MYPLLQRWAAAIDKRQRQWADYLNRKTEKYSKRSKQIVLAAFCLLFGSSSVYIIFRAIENPSGRIAIEKMSFPKYVTSSDTINRFQAVSVLTEKQYQNIQRFRKYMDSLQTTKAGMIKYESIIKARPGLMDSIDFIEQVYRQQTKTK